MEQVSHISNLFTYQLISKTNANITFNLQPSDVFKIFCEIGETLQ